MGNLRVDTITNEDGSSGPFLDGNLEFSSGSYVYFPKGTTAERPVGASAGSLRYNTDDNNLEYYNGTLWVSLNYAYTAYGFFGGGFTPTPASIYFNTIDYITIATTGDATDFGDLTTVRSRLAACSSSTRGIFGSGFAPTSSPSTTNTIDYITISSLGNATSDFGDLTVARTWLAACSSSTRGVFGGGDPRTNTIDYITIASESNATDFGDLTVARYGLSACSSSTRGVFGGGYAPGFSNVLDYITIATTGDATNFGDLTVTRRYLAACSSSTIGVFGGGATPSRTNTIDYITIATTGNATDFGDLTVLRERLAACSSSTRGVFGGGAAPTTQNVLDYITIATTGNATDFGDLTLSRYDLAACSSAHGGLS